MEMHSRLSALNETRNDLFLRVRVTRIWNTTTNSGILVRHNLILLDCGNDHMHAVVAPEIWNNFAGIMKAGSRYEIKNMNVTPATGLFRHVHSRVMVHFTRFTTVALDKNDDLSIPMHKFDILPLNEARGTFFSSLIDHQHVYSTDFVGVVENLEAMRTMQTRYGPRDVVGFNISDGLIRRRVSFISPLPENVASLYEPQLEIPVIVILASTRVSAFRSAIIIGNLPSTKVYVNIDHPQVFLMRQRLQDIGYLPAHAP